MDCTAPVFAANPGLSQSLPANQPGATVQVGASCSRTVTAGGFVSDMLLHPQFTPLQYMYRRLPLEGMFASTTQRPFTFEAGAFTVPQNFALAVAEYRFQIYYWDALGEAVPLEDGRLPLSIGYDLNFDQYRKANMRNELLPSPPDPRSAAFDGNPAGGFSSSGGDPVATLVSGIYNAVGPVPGVTPDANNFVQTAAAGEGLLPQTNKGVQGPSRWPFTFVAESNQAVQMRITSFGRITIPIAFFEATLLGYLIPSNTLRSMMEALKPCV